MLGSITLLVGHRRCSKECRAERTGELALRTRLYMLSLLCLICTRFSSHAAPKLHAICVESFECKGIEISERIKVRTKMWLLEWRERELGVGSRSADTTKAGKVQSRIDILLLIRLRLLFRKCREIRDKSGMNRRDTSGATECRVAPAPEGASGSGTGTCREVFLSVGFSKRACVALGVRDRRRSAEGRRGG